MFFGTNTAGGVWLLLGDKAAGLDSALIISKCWVNKEPCRVNISNMIYMPPGHQSSSLSHQ